jgi:hypothetical protein
MALAKTGLSRRSLGEGGSRIGAKTQKDRSSLFPNRMATVFLYTLSCQEVHPKN